jgi:hypothetical protein
LGIVDLNQRWEAGGDFNYYDSRTPITVDGYTFVGSHPGEDTSPDNIGVVGLTWSDSLITFSGFGNALPNYYPYGYHIHNGDKILIVIFTNGGTVWAVTTYTGPSV